LKKKLTRDKIQARQPKLVAREATKPITEIDEEDLEDSELDINTAVQVSLSIARPPKQKSSTDWTGVTGVSGSSKNQVQSDKNAAKKPQSRSRNAQKASAKAL